jgi:hypothetical protein
LKEIGLKNTIFLYYIKKNIIIRREWLGKGKFEVIATFLQTYQRPYIYKLFEHSANHNIFILELVKRRGRKVHKVNNSKNKF